MLKMIWTCLNEVEWKKNHALKSISKNIAFLCFNVFFPFMRGQNNSDFFWFYFVPTQRCMFVQYFLLTCFNSFANCQVLCQHYCELLVFSFTSINILYCIPEYGNFIRFSMENWMYLWKRVFFFVSESEAKNVSFCHLEVISLKYFKLSAHNLIHLWMKTNTESIFFVFHFTWTYIFDFSRTKFGLDNKKIGKAHMCDHSLTSLKFDVNIAILDLFRVIANSVHSEQIGIDSKT